MNRPTGALPPLYSKPTPEPKYIHIDIDESGNFLIHSKNIGVANPLEDSNEELVATLQSIIDFMVAPD